MKYFFFYLLFFDTETDDIISFKGFDVHNFKRRKPFTYFAMYAKIILQFIILFISFKFGTGYILYAIHAIEETLWKHHIT